MDQKTNTRSMEIRTTFLELINMKTQEDKLRFDIKWLEAHLKTATENNDIRLEREIKRKLDVLKSTLLNLQWI